MKKHILFVDDEPNILEGLRRLLHDQGAVWNMTFVNSADAALDVVREKPLDTIVCDVKMPGKDGFELLRNLQEIEHGDGVPVIMVTGASESGLKRRALRRGATDLLSKPVDREDLLARISSVLRLKDYQDAIKAQNELLERQVQERTRELADSRLEIIWHLGKAAEYRDEATGNHVVRVGYCCRAIAGALGMDPHFTEMLFLTSPLHDIGKIGIPDHILLKPGQLSEEEWHVMQQHCVIGAKILQQDCEMFDPYPSRRLRAPHQGRNKLIQMASAIALTHHEWWDGSGYPLNLLEEEIPLESRITALSDCYDSLRSARPYKPAFSESEALEIIRHEVGRHFDPAVYAAFERCLEEIRAIRSQFSDERAGGGTSRAGSSFPAGPTKPVPVAE